MDVQAGLADGVANVAINTALGTISLAMSPQDVAKHILTAWQAVQKARVAAGICERILVDIQETTMNRLPLMCELLHFGHIFEEFPGEQRTSKQDLNGALLRCFKSVCDALHDARTVMYEYLQLSTWARWGKAAEDGVKEALTQIQTRLTNRFNDISAYVQLATFLRGAQSAQQAQHTAAMVARLERQVREVVAVRSAKKNRVRDIAQAAVARQSKTGQKIRVSRGSKVVAVAVSPSGDAFATGSDAESADSTAAVWDAATGARMHKLRGHDTYCAVAHIAWSPDESMVAAASGVSTVIWDAATGARKHELCFPSHSVRAALSNKVLSVTWSPCGSMLATGDLKRASLWDAATGSLVHELRVQDGVTSVSWSPDGSMVATASFNTTAAVWDVATGNRMHKLQGHSDQVGVVTWSPDGSMVATGSVDHSAAVWDVATGGRMHVLPAPGAGYRSVAWRPEWLATPSESAEAAVAVWEVPCVTSEWLSVYGKHGKYAWFRKFAWSLDRSRVITGELYSDTSAMPPDWSRAFKERHATSAAVWDVATGTCMHELTGHTGAVEAVAWSPDGCEVYTASSDGTVRIYSLTNRDELDMHVSWGPSVSGGDHRDA